MPRGSPLARKRRSTAAISASGTAWPPPEPPIRIVSPERTRLAASSAVTRRMRSSSVRLELAGEMAGGEVAAGVLDERRRYIGAHGSGDRATGAEPAARWRVDGA